MHQSSFIQHSFVNQLPLDCSTPNSQSPNSLISDVYVKEGKPKEKGSFKFKNTKGPEFGGKIYGPDVDVNVKAPSISGSLSGSGPDIKVKAPKVKAPKADLDLDGDVKVKQSSLSGSLSGSISGPDIKRPKFKQQWCSIA